MKRKPIMTTQTLAYCSLLAALSIILARLLSFSPEPYSRISFESIPLFLSGMLFGPIAGILVGFAADSIGAILFSPYGFNPLYCIPPILYGVFGGLFRNYLAKNLTPLRLGIAFLPPIALGSILYQSIPLALAYFRDNFQQGYLFLLWTRTIQFGVFLVLDVLVIWLLFKSGIFKRLNIWPPKR